jgi:hypothetical protein
MAGIVQEYVALEICWDIQGEGVLPRVHAVVHFAQLGCQCGRKTVLEGVD